MAPNYEDSWYWLEEKVDPFQLEVGTEIFKKSYALIEGEGSRVNF